MDRPVAARGLKSYRYQGAYGYIMIGAAGNGDALNEASRSMTNQMVAMDKLEIWNGFQYTNVTDHRHILWVKMPESVLGDQWFVGHCGSQNSCREKRQKLLYTGLTGCGDLVEILPITEMIPS